MRAESIRHGSDPHWLDLMYRHVHTQLIPGDRYGKDSEGQDARDLNRGAGPDSRERDEDRVTPPPGIALGNQIVADKATQSLQYRFQVPSSCRCSTPARR